MSNYVWGINKFCVFNGFGAGLCRQLVGVLVYATCVPLVTDFCFAVGEILWFLFLMLKKLILFGHLAWHRSTWAVFQDVVSPCFGAW